MPTYEYKCDACGHELEKFQSIMAKPLRKCPECGKPKLKRLIGTGSAIVFKGSGFWQTDYRSEGYKKSAAADKKSSEPASESKSDSKPEKKAPEKPGKDGGKKSEAS